MLKETRCRKCDAVFSFEYSGKGGVKYICETCRRQARQQYEQARFKPSDGNAPHGNAIKSTELNSNKDVAKFLGISAGHVDRIARSAIAKLQKNKELRELWRACMEEGLPAHEDWGEQILDYQVELMRFYETYDQLRVWNCEAEALECLSEIRKFQQALGKAMGMETET
jgi:hypothetical protein